MLCSKNIFTTWGLLDKLQQITSLPFNIWSKETTNIGFWWHNKLFIYICAAFCAPSFGKMVVKTLSHLSTFNRLKEGLDGSTELQGWRLNFIHFLFLYLNVFVCIGRAYLSDSNIGYKTVTHYIFITAS